MSFQSKMKGLLLPVRLKRELAAQAEANHKAVMDRIDKLDQKLEYLFWLSQQKPGEAMEETKRRVFLSMPKAEGSTRIKQKGNLFLLRALKQVCDEHNIRFSLALGTLLGAVRHQGFVPWDDDVDIFMLREDFTRLCAALEGNELLRIEFCYDPHLFYQFVKLKFRRSETFFVDLFILDRFEANEKSFIARYEELKKAHDRFVSATKEIMLRHGADQWQTLMPLENDEIRREAKAVFSEICGELSYYGDGSYLCVGIDGPGFVRNQGYAYRCDEMLPYTKNALIFEGDRYDSLRDPERWLSNAYDDYRSLPKSICPGHPELSLINEADLSLLKELGAIEEADLVSGRTLDALRIHF